MSSNYLRYYEVIIGSPEEYDLVDSVNPPPILTKENKLPLGNTPLNFMTIRKLEGVGVSISGLQIQADVRGDTETQGSQGRSCNLKIYNLSEETVQYVLKENLKVIIKAGYKDDYDRDNLPVIFSGQIKTSKRNLKGMENSVEFLCVDGYTPSTAIKIGTTLKSTPEKLISVQDIFDYLISVWDKNGISSTTSSIRYDGMTPHPSEITFKGGWVGEGYLRDVMDELCEALGYQWYIVNATLYIQNKTDNRQREVFVVGGNLIKSIEEGEWDEKSDSNSASKPKIILTTFLNGNIAEGKYINIPSSPSRKAQSSIYIGTYKILSVKHVLDYRGDKWDTVVECEKV